MEHGHTNRSSMVGGLLLVGLGLLLLIGQNFQFGFFKLFENWSIPYTTYIIVPGVVFMAVGLLGGRNLTGITILGSIVLVSGLLLAFQDSTMSYQTWAYLWALVFPGSIGMALASQSMVTRDSKQLKAGLNMIVVALSILLVGWSFFEGALDLSGYELAGWSRFVGPLVLIGLGGWLLLRQRPVQEEL